MLFLLASSAAILLYCAPELVLRSASCFQSVLHSISAFAAGSHKELCCKSCSAPDAAAVVPIQLLKAVLDACEGHVLRM